MSLIEFAIIAIPSASIGLLVYLFVRGRQYVREVTAVAAESPNYRISNFSEIRRVNQEAGRRFIDDLRR